MQDLACLIAPRKFIPIAGKDDLIFPIHGVREAFETVEKIYHKENAEQNCRLYETTKAHWWCEDVVWPAINEAMASL